MRLMSSKAAVLGGLLLLCGSLAMAKNPAVTNLLQLRQLAQTNICSVADISVGGIVCEAVQRNGILILNDGDCTELLELDLSGLTLQPGQKIRLIGESCEVTRRRTGIGLRRPPLINNDGLHGVRQKTATVELAAGRQPVLVEWFNAGGFFKLSVEFAGPDFSRRTIPDASLSHDEQSSADGSVSVAPGLVFRAFEGSWRILPDFGNWPESHRGLATNFTLAAFAPGENIGVVFSGFLTVTQAGNYTFYLSSDDGSRLVLGETLPRVEVLGQNPVPPPKQNHIGQIAGQNDPGRWCIVEGVVRYAAVRGHRLELELRSPSNNRLQVDIMDGEGLSPALLLNSQVRLTGVGRQVFSAGGQSILGLLTAIGSDDVQILEVPTEIWLAHPLEAITNVCEEKLLSNLTRLSGKLEKSDTRTESQITDTTGKVFIKRTTAAAAFAGRVVEALGVPTRQGTNWILTGACVRGVSQDSSAPQLRLLTTAQQVLQLPRNEAARGYSVRLRGVITCVWPDDLLNTVLQDGTRGIFLLQPTNALPDRPQFGEYWEIEGVSAPGDFSPMVKVSSMRRISDGRLPEAVRPEWDQLVNGSLDNQYVEIEGVVLHADKKSLTLLAHWGKINVSLFGETPPALGQYENKLVRLRGCLQAQWDGVTHQVKAGEIRIGGLIINADQSFSADPFAAPVKQVPELRLYDFQANALRRVKISGQFLQQRGGEGFMVSGTNGLRFIANEVLELKPGDLIDVAGVPDLRGAAPVLREAVVRKTGRADLPVAKSVPPEKLLSPQIDSTRVVVEGTLLNVQRSRDETIFEMRAGLRTFAARVTMNREIPEVWEPGSKLRLTGIYDWQSAGRDASSSPDVFVLLLDSPRDIQVLSRPPWWTFKKLLLALGMLVGVLALAGVWIVLLRRQVERRTAQLERANRQREQAERARVLNEERLRIARDLHDDLGSSLTEITMLGGMGLAEKEMERGHTISQIVKKARDSVNALDVIVWAVNPKENSLQSLADYLASFADEFLASSGIACRLNLPVSFPAVTLDGRTRHDLFLATKEALNNAVRHARATEVELSIALQQGTLIIGVRDNGTGFEKSVKTFGHGLGNLQSRLEKLGGECQIETVAGGGTNVTLKLTLPAGS